MLFRSRLIHLLHPGSKHNTPACQLSTATREGNHVQPGNRGKSVSQPETDKQWDQLFSSSSSGVHAGILEIMKNMKANCVVLTRLKLLLEELSDVLSPRCKETSQTTSLSQASFELPSFVHSMVFQCLIYLDFWRSSFW